MRPTGPPTALRSGPLLALAALLLPLLLSPAALATHGSPHFRVAVTPAEVFVGETAHLSVSVRTLTTNVGVSGRNVTLVQNGANLTPTKPTDATGRAPFTVFITSDSPITVLVDGMAHGTLTPAVGLTVTFDAEAYEPGRLATATVTQRGSIIGVEDATLRLGSTVLGSTFTDGTLVFKTPGSAGDYTIVAERTGYVSGSATLHILPPPGEPRFELTDLRLMNTAGDPVSSLRTGETLVVEASVTNVGTAAGELPVRLFVNGRVYESQTVRLAPSETTLVSFTRTFESEGRFSITLNSLPPRPLVVDAAEAPPTTTAPPGPQPTTPAPTPGPVFNPATSSYMTPPPTQGASPPSFMLSDVSYRDESHYRPADGSRALSVTASILNTGGTGGTYDAVLTLAGEVKARRSVYVGPSSAATVTFSLVLPPGASGAVAVNGETARALYTGEAPAAPEETTLFAWTTLTSPPGLLIGGGALLALVGVTVGATLLVRRRAPGAPAAPPAPPPPPPPPAPVTPVPEPRSEWAPPTPEEAARERLATLLDAVPGLAVGRAVEAHLQAGSAEGAQAAMDEAEALLAARSDLALRVEETKARLAQLDADLAAGAISSAEYGPRCDAAFAEQRGFMERLAEIEATLFG